MLGLHCATIQGTGGSWNGWRRSEPPRGPSEGCLTGWYHCWRSRRLRHYRAPTASSRSGVRRHVAPNEAALRRAIRSVDPDQLDRVLGGSGRPIENSDDDTGTLSTPTTRRVRHRGLARNRPGLSLQEAAVNLRRLIAIGLDYGNAEWMLA
jgi:hypothetical protein